MADIELTDPAQWLDEHARATPHKPLMTLPDRRQISYAQLAEQSCRLAQAALSLGVQRGDRILAQVDKTPQAVALYLACLRIGAIFVPMNTAYTQAELEYFLGDTAPALAVVRPQMQAVVAALAERCKIRQVVTLDAAGEGSLMALAATASAELPPPGSDPDTLATLLYTSGTTGRSKGAMITRGNLASNARTLAQAWEFSSEDVLLHALPIFHVHGLYVAINTVLAAGASMVFLPRFDADELLRWLPHATVLMGVPTFYTRLLDHPGLNAAVASGMRLFISGSAPLLTQTHRAFRERTGHEILERYGMSETLMNTSNPCRGARIPGSVGPALPGIEVRITDPDSGAPLTAVDATGMIEVRGPNVFKGYWGMPERCASDFRDGFFITGDLGRIDAQGYVHIVGREKDLIITGGYNVYPVEVEQVLDALPGVIESAVIGVPHPDFGEGVTAVVVRDAQCALDEAAMLAALSERLAKFKLPKRILCRDELPRNTMGKVQKNLLRQACHDLYRAAQEHSD